VGLACNAYISLTASQSTVIATHSTTISYSHCTNRKVSNEHCGSIEDHCPLNCTSLLKHRIALRQHHVASHMFTQHLLTSGTSPQHGTCQPGGHCACKGVWAGPGCEVASEQLLDGQIVKGVKVGKYGSRFFHFYATPSDSVKVAITKHIRIKTRWHSIGVKLQL
jgi:hypothetical protein